MNVNCVIGVLFIGAFPAVMFACAAWIWPEPFAWVCIAVGMMWLPLLLTGLGVVPTNSQRDIDESAEIETIHIGLIALDQREKGDFYAQCIGMLNECTEHHPAYETNSGVRRWKVGKNHPYRQGLTNSGTTGDIMAAAKSLLK